MLSPRVSSALLLRFRVEGEEVARRRRVDPLLDREADPRLGLLVALSASAMLQQRAGVQQVHLGEIGAAGVAVHSLAGEAPVARRGASPRGVSSRFQSACSAR